MTASVNNTDIHGDIKVCQVANSWNNFYLST